MSLIDENMAEQAALGWFEELGYLRAFGPDLAPDGPQQERDTYKQVVLTDRLLTALTRLNPHLPASALEDAFRQITHSNIVGLMQANRQFHRWLTDGVPVEINRDGETLGDAAKLIDFNHPDNNEWLVVNQYSVEGPKHTRRPDVVVFVNGLPLAVIELKNPADTNADIWKAFDQLQTYKVDIPELFVYNEVLVISDYTLARAGSLSADQERFTAWRTIDGVALDPLGELQQLETLIRGLFSKDLFLDYLRHFVLFEEDGNVKKIAAYHQFHAVRVAVQSAIQASQPGGTRKGGVIWHTQGSGKSLEMTCLAGYLMGEPAMANPTIVVVTDRNDLDSQLFEIYAAATDLLRETPIQAETRQDLRDKLAKRPSGGILFTTIQKFSPLEEEDTFPELSDRANIIVICDEAHRSQYGFGASLSDAGGDTAVRYGYAHYLRQGLPNATFVAFTGTPISSDDRDTRAVFGEYVHVYDVEQAVKDGATVPIYYESRLAKLQLKEAEAPKLNDEVDELTEDEEATTKALTQRRWAALEKVVGAQPRVQKVAEDIVQHFEARRAALEGKAMVVAMSREVCVHLYNAIVALKPEWHDEDPEKGAIKIVMTGSASDKALLRPHIYPSEVKKRLEKRFKDPDDPLKVVIVRDMWLTGFDAPCAHTMYVDKPMKGHNLMQAIARVNRVFKDKPGGLVVDYIGIAAELKLALIEYTNSKGRGRPTIDAQEAMDVLNEKISVLRGILHGFDYVHFRTKALVLLAGACNHVLGLEDGKKRFADHTLAATKAFALCCTLDEAKTYREELAFFQAIKSALVKHDGQDKKLSDEAKEHALRQIISGALVSDEVVDIFAAAGLKKPNIGILTEEFLDDVRHMKQRNLAVELLERLLRDDIKSRFATNVVQSQKFSELLQASLVRYHNRAIETGQVIEELIALAKEFNVAARRGEELGLSPRELAFYDALETNEASVRELGDSTLKEIARQLTDYLRNNLSVDWSVRETVRAKMRVQIKLILKRHKYPIDREAAAVETVLKQAEALSEELLLAA
ncbi:type I restriction endonuclease subunit R [Acidithiobacillus sp.]|uniref:type I restriction endonuclease subunit R n=1 Tax=Acidithiobacillus sp. TaxID=1872118 RepID=UPI0031FE867B